jgi:hypothetical protein
MPGLGLETLLDHVSDSIGALQQAISAGDVAPAQRCPVTPGWRLTLSRACAARPPGC